LPRKSDAQSGEDFATIGHKTQWRDYIVANVSYKPFNVPGGLILAISKEDALNAYQSERNLEPQGMSFNSQIATSYSSDPLYQEWSNV
jgi:hypothetical protein